MQLSGIHHLTAVSADAPGNVAFYTNTLGMRLVKKTVNQDDVSAYHLFYADGEATPGTDLTFFDWPSPRERRGTHSIVRTGLRVTGEESLRWWQSRFDELRVAHDGVTLRDGRATLDFEDPEGQRLSLVVDGGRGPAHPWHKSPVPPEHQVRGLGPITLSVPALRDTELVLTKLMNMRHVREYSGLPSERRTWVRHNGGTGSGTGTAGTSTVAGAKAGGAAELPPTTTHVYEMGEGGPAAELHVAVEPHLAPARSGAGGVHHVAFRTPDAAQYEAWNERLRQAGVRGSGPVDRYYFRSLYFREPNGILFEIATDGPGFATDEPLEHLGERLALPPFLEPRRKEIEAGLKPL
jgi:glyoxalase family protein